MVHTSPFLQRPPAEELLLSAPRVYENITLALDRWVGIASSLLEENTRCISCWNNNAEGAGTQLEQGNPVSLAAYAPAHETRRLRYEQLVQKQHTPFRQQVAKFFVPTRCLGSRLGVAS